MIRRVIETISILLSCIPHIWELTDKGKIRLVGGGIPAQKVFTTVSAEPMKVTINSVEGLQALVEDLDKEGLLEGYRKKLFDEITGGKDAKNNINNN